MYVWHTSNTHVHVSSQMRCCIDKSISHPMNIMSCSGVRLRWHLEMHDDDVYGLKHDRMPLLMMFLFITCHKLNDTVAKARALNELLCVSTHTCCCMHMYIYTCCIPVCFRCESKQHTASPLIVTLSVTHTRGIFNCKAHFSDLLCVAVNNNVRHMT